MSTDYRNIIKNVDESEYEFVTYYKDYIVVKTAGRWKERLEKMPEYSTSCTPAERLQHLKKLTKQLTNVDQEQEHRRLLELIMSNRALSGLTELPIASENSQDADVTLDDVYAICVAAIDEMRGYSRIVLSRKDFEILASELLDRDVSALFKLYAAAKDEKTAPNYLLSTVRTLLLNFLVTSGGTTRFFAALY